MDSKPHQPITVLIAEDFAAFRKSLKLLVQADTEIRVVGEAKDGLEAVLLAKALKPKVIVMDIAMPSMNGLQATEKIMTSSLGIRILILSAHPDPEYIEMAMRFGASGYLLKQSSTEFLAQAIHEVHAGRTYLSRSFSKELRHESQVVFDRIELSRKKAA